MLEKKLTLPSEVGGGEERFWLEVLTGFNGARNVPEIVSIFHTDTEYLKEGSENLVCKLCNEKEGCPKVEEKVKSYAYEFDLVTGELKSIATYEGDFSEEVFRWAENRIEEKSEEELNTAEIAMAYQAAQRVDYQLKEERRDHTLMIKEQDKLDELRKALYKIVNREMPEGYERWEDLDRKALDEVEGASDEELTGFINTVLNKSLGGSGGVSGNKKINNNSTSGSKGFFPGVGSPSSPRGANVPGGMSSSNGVYGPGIPGGKQIFDDKDFDSKCHNYDTKDFFSKYNGGGYPGDDSGLGGLGPSGASAISSEKKTNSGPLWERMIDPEP